jgi:predicted DNA binding CopG/RHH family protein
METEEEEEDVVMVYRKLSLRGSQEEEKEEEGVGHQKRKLDKTRITIRMTKKMIAAINQKVAEDIFDFLNFFSIRCG